MVIEDSPPTFSIMADLGEISRDRKSAIMEMASAEPFITTATIFLIIFTFPSNFLAANPNIFVKSKSNL